MEKNWREEKSIFEKIYENMKQKKLPILQVINLTENQNENFNNLYNPIIPLKKIGRKKGRKLKNEIVQIKAHERIHSRLNSDNIKRKIKTHFHCFIISYLNLIIKEEWGGIQKYKFKKMDSETTQNITIAYNKILLNPPIKELLKKVSNKFNDHLSNERILSKIPSSKIQINKLLNCSYREMYENYYLKSRNDLFKNEKENNSFENHLLKIKNKFGNDYMEKYKKNAVNFIQFFLKCRERKKKPLSSNFDDSSESNVNYNEFNISVSTNSNNSNSLIFVTKLEDN